MSNNNDEILKFLGICVVVGLLVFYGVKFLRLQAQVLEGATNMTDGSTSASSSTNGIGGSASQYNTTIKAEVTKMQDTLLVPKYRSEYENVLLNLDDYLNLAMLKTSLSINLTHEIEPGRANPNIALLSSLKVLSDAKGTLNSIMKYLDTH
jgi:hypothetical protein